MLSPNFQVQNFEVEEYNQNPLFITYQFKDSEKKKTNEIFKVGSSFPSTKTITFDNKLGKADILVHYGDDAKLLQGLPTSIA